MVASSVSLNWWSTSIANVQRDLGLTPAQVASVLRTGLAGSTTGTFRPDGTRGWDITVILNPEDRARVAQVTDIR